MCNCIFTSSRQSQARSPGAEVSEVTGANLQRLTPDSSSESSRTVTPSCSDLSVSGGNWCKVRRSECVCATVAESQQPRPAALQSQGRCRIRLLTVASFRSAASRLINEPSCDEDCDEDFRCFESFPASDRAAEALLLRTMCFLTETLFPSEETL